MSSKDIKDIFRLHKMYLEYQVGGARADLRGADLSNANLRDANLSEANLRGANLRGANLRDAHLRGANLSNADLSEADLSNANLRDADLSNANLRDADLSEANLRDANLRDANLRGANLRGANLSNADLSDANLYGANLRDAHLRGAIDGEINRMDFGSFSVCVRHDYTQIGCQRKDNSFLLSASLKEIAEIHEEAEEFWKMHGLTIKVAIRAVRKQRKLNSTKDKR